MRQLTDTATALYRNNEAPVGCFNNNNQRVGQ